MSESREERPKLELSPTKIAAGAAAAATAAAIGSTLGTAGTIAGAAVASAVSASASALYSHSLERGRDVAKKALPLTVHEAGTSEIHAAHGLRRLKSAGYPHVGAPLGDGALDETVVLWGGPNAETVLLPGVSGAGASGTSPRKWTGQLPGWRTLTGVTTMMFVLGIGAVAGVNLARGNNALENVVSPPSRSQGGQPSAPGQPTHENSPTERSTAPTPTPSGSGTTPTPTPAPSTQTTAPATPSATGPTTNPGTTTTGPSTPATPGGGVSSPANGGSSARG